MKRLAFFLGFMLGLGFSASRAGAQAPPPVTRIVYTHQAEAFLDSLAHNTRTLRIEDAGCAVSFTVRGDTLLLERFVRSKVIVTADSANVRSTSPYLCQMGVPSIHTHLLMPGYEWWQASQDADVPTSQRTGVWAMVLVVSDHGWNVVVY